MAHAWQEVYGGLSRLYLQVSVSDAQQVPGAAQQVSAEGQQVPGAAQQVSAEGPAISVATARPPELGEERTAFYVHEWSGEGNEEVGYRGPTACAAAGITYRQLAYWTSTGLVEPSVRGAHESGSERLYSFRDILVLKVVKRLLDTGISLQQIRSAIHHLRDRETSGLAQVALMSDGVDVYECSSADEVLDLLQGGQGVFGIALGRVWQEVEENLLHLPAVRAKDGLLATDSDIRDRKGSERAG